MKTTTPFGAFVEIMPGTEGLVHISELQARPHREDRRRRQEGRSREGQAARPRRAWTSAPVDEGAGAEAGRDAGAGAASAAWRGRRWRASASENGGDRGGTSSRRWARRRALAPLVAARWTRRGGRRVPPHRSAEWTDRTLGAHAGSAVGRVWGLGSRGVAARAARADGRLAPARAHGVQGDGAPFAPSRSRSSLEALGGSLDAYTSREHTVYQARVLDEHLDDRRRRDRRLRLRPVASRESDLELERKVVLEEIAMVDDTPDDLVFELHNEALWGAHPYGYSILGTRDTVHVARRRAIFAALHERAYHPGQLVVAASGNVEHDAAARRPRANGLDRRAAAATRRGSPFRRRAPTRADASRTSSARARRRTSSSAPTTVAHGIRAVSRSCS